jgi:hypothetical protein
MPRLYVREEAGIVRKAESATSTLRSEHGKTVLDRILEGAGALGRGSAGVP